jgi:hypothetical protein
VQWWICRSRPRGRRRRSRWGLMRQSLLRGDLMSRRQYPYSLSTTPSFAVVSKATSSENYYENRQFRCYFGVNHRCAGHHSGCEGQPRLQPEPLAANRLPAGFVRSRVRVSGRPCDPPCRRRLLHRLPVGHAGTPRSCLRQRSRIRHPVRSRPAGDSQRVMAPPTTDISRICSRTRSNDTRHR